jgi:uracil-DNA glycosylase
MPITWTQLDLLKPEIIICLGRFVGEQFGITEYNQFKQGFQHQYIMVKHPSYLYRTGTFDIGVNEVKQLLAHK